MKNRLNPFKYVWKGRKKISVALINLLLPVSAMAYSTNDKMSEILDDTIDLITGKWGTSLCVLAIMAVGFLWMKMGKMEKDHAMATVVGIGIVYAAGFIVKTKFGID